MVDTSTRPLHLPDVPAPPTGGRASAHPAPESTQRARVDVAALGEALLGDWAAIRKQSRALASRAEFQKVEGLTLDEQRRRTHEQTRMLAEQGQVNLAFPREYGGLADNGGNLAAFEELTAADPSLQIKSGVQWGLFGAAIMQLGTKRHHDAYLRDVMSFALPGAFAMTETGHGSDVASVATTATYDAESREFVIHTPFRAAWKDYLGNAAQDALAAVVFAQLISDGANRGVHAFFVPIRDAESGQFLPGVSGEDDGLKGGLNGVDNGRLCFDHVRVPRQNLLNKYGDVAENGEYTSPIASPGRRFFTMLGTLVQGRVSLDGSATVASKMALAIAITYGSQRRQFTAGTNDEEVLLDYQRHQRRLLPRLATTYAGSFAHEVLLRKFDDVFSGKADTDADRQDLETLAAALKPLSTWHALDCLQEAREACGGAGFLTENRLTSLRADLDVYVTFEGDNNVLLQLVAKRLLSDYARRFSGADAGTLARYAVGDAARRAVQGSGLRSAGQTVRDLGSTARSVNWLQDELTQRRLLEGRVESMVSQIAAVLRPARSLSKRASAQLFNSQQNALIEAARAHAELLQWQAFTDALARIDDVGTRRVLTWLRDLFGLGLIEKHAAWYLMNGTLAPKRALAVSAYIDRLIARLRPHALDLVDAFQLTPELLRSSIATGAEQRRQDEARDYLRRARNEASDAGGERR